MDLLVGDCRYAKVDGKYVFHGYVWLFRRNGTVHAQQVQREASVRK